MFIARRKKRQGQMEKSGAVPWGGGEGGLVTSFGGDGGGHRGPGFSSPGSQALAPVRPPPPAINFAARVGPGPFTPASPTPQRPAAHEPNSRFDWAQQGSFGWPSQRCPLAMASGALSPYTLSGPGPGFSVPALPAPLFPNFNKQTSAQDKFSSRDDQAKKDSGSQGGGTWDSIGTGHQRPQPRASPIDGFAHNRLRQGLEKFEKVPVERKEPGEAPSAGRWRSDPGPDDGYVDDFPESTPSSVEKEESEEESEEESDEEEDEEDRRTHRCSQCLASKGAGRTALVGLEELHWCSEDGALLCAQCCLSEDLPHRGHVHRLHAAHLVRQRLKEEVWTAYEPVRAEAEAKVVGAAEALRSLLGPGLGLEAGLSEELGAVLRRLWARRPPAWADVAARLDAAIADHMCAGGRDLSAEDFTPDLEAVRSAGSAADEAAALAEETRALVADLRGRWRRLAGIEEGPAAAIDTTQPPAAHYPKPSSSMTNSHPDLADVHKDF